MLLTLLSLQLAAVPVSQWAEPGFQVLVSESHVSARGHVGSRGDADALLAVLGDDRTRNEELRLHVLLPDGWQGLSESAVAALNAFHTGELRLDRDRLELRGFIMPDAEVDTLFAALLENAPPHVDVSVDYSLLRPDVLDGACAALFDSLPSQPLLFDRNSSAVRGADIPRLNRLADSLNHCPDYRLNAVGHSDGIGTQGSNNAMSELRASSVIAHLVKRGVNPERLTFRGAGAADPVASNETWEGRNSNRRVELEVYSPAGAASAGP